MVKGIYVDLLKYYGPNGILLPFDVDLTLRNTMATDTPNYQHAMMMELHLRTGGGVLVMTGRSSASADRTLRGKFPGSFEHHSAMRFEQGGDVISLAPQLDTKLVAKYASEFIGSKIPIATEPDEVRQSEGKFSSVYPEVKQFAVALVHSLGHDNVAEDRKVIIQAAEYAIEKMGIGHTHKIAKGNDAIEIVPKGLCSESTAKLTLNKEEVLRLEQNGLNKGAGLHNFMSLPQYTNRTPFFSGDSGTDGVAMLAAEQYGGGGVWVNNGHRVPEEFAKAVGNRQIDSHLVTWPELEIAVEYLRQKCTVFAVTRGNGKDGPQPL